MTKTYNYLTYEIMTSLLANARYRGPSAELENSTPEARNPLWVFSNKTRVTVAWTMTLRLDRANTSCVR